MNQTSLRISRLTCLLLLLFALAPSAAPAGAAPAFTSLYQFSALDMSNDNSDGGEPAALVKGSDGDFYGTTSYGGSGGYGTVFKITPEGALTTLVNFTGTNGAYPLAPVQGSDGNFYGTTAGGGSSYVAGSNLGAGTVFKLTPTGTLTTLFNFDYANGANPDAALVQGSDGNFYGTTVSGGTGDIDQNGAVFKVTPAGTLTALYDFSGTDGAGPHQLIQGGDGNFYGTTTFGGSSQEGTAFKLTPAGALTTLVTFTDANGRNPATALVQGGDGNFYGTTDAGGKSELGTVFKMTPLGHLTTLVLFNGMDGYSPNGLVLGSDGNFYGTTYSGGANNDGTVFQMTPSGTLATIYTFSAQHVGINADGAYPDADLVQGSDGDFYGVTQQGGAAGTGTVFKVRALPIITGFTPNIGPVGTNVTITGMNLTGTTIVGFQNAHATSFTVNSSGTQITTTVPAGAQTGPISVLTSGIEARSSMNYAIAAAIPTPTIIGFSPASGPAGTAVTITGTNLTNTAVVGFMGQHAISFTVNAAGTQITTTVPRGAQTGPVAVSTNGIEAKSSMSFTVNASPPAPTITGFSPASDPVGTVVTITGTNLTGTTIVGFMGQHATSFTVNAAGTQITTTVPSGAQTGPVAVLTNGTEAKSPTSFTVTP